MKRRPIRYDPKNDYYTRIGVKPSATQEEIQQAYRQKAKQLHPDLNPDRKEWATTQFQLLNEAYDVLGNPSLRPKYDEQRYLHLPFGARPKGAAPNWWDVPHAAQPGYSGVRSAPPPPYRSTYVWRRPGAWLEHYGLGFLRPFYAPVVELILSPYRYVLGFLSLVLVVNLVFVLMALSSSDEQVPEVGPPNQPTAAAQQGFVPTPLPRRSTPTPFLDSSMIVLHPCSSEISLAVDSVEWLTESVKVVARVQQLARVANTRIMRVQLMDNALVKLVEPAQNLELILREEASATPTPTSQRLIVPDMPPGIYLIEWTPISQTGQVGEFCHQLIYLVNE